MTYLQSEIINNVLHGDALAELKKFPDKIVDCVVTSPPYWNLRDYESEGQLGLEPMFNEYVNKLSDIFSEVMRVLKDSGSVWINIGDTYFGSTKVKTNTGDKFSGTDRIILSKKCLTLVPYRFAIEMINRGWILRNNIIWHKPSVMPRPVKDRFNIDYENVFFFTKDDEYYFKQQFEKMLTKVNANASSEEGKYKNETLKISSKSMSKYSQKVENGEVTERIKRCVWTVNTSSDKSHHVAPFSEDLIRPMIDAGCPEGGLVLDMFMGTGTTALVALKQGKKFVGIDVDERSVLYAKERIYAFQNQSTIFDLI